LLKGLSFGLVLNRLKIKTRLSCAEILKIAGVITENPAEYCVFPNDGLNRNL